MALIARSSLILPQILQDAIKGAFAGMRIFAGSPAVIMNGSLPQDKRGGDTVTIPYFSTVGEFADVAEGTPLTTDVLSMSSDTSAIQHSGKAFEMTQWARMAAAYADPYAEAGRQVAEALQRRADKAILDAAVASAPAGFLSNVFTKTSPSVAANNLNYASMVNAKMLWGDEQDDVAMLAVHSQTYGALLRLVDGFGRPLLTQPNDGGLERFIGVPIMKSDRLPVDLSNLNAAGTSPPAAPTISGTAAIGTVQLQIKINVGGTLGTATFSFSTDGGLTFSTPVLASSSGVALGATGLTATFVAGTYTNDNVYTAVPKHTSLMIKKNALVFWYTGAPPVEIFRDVLLDAEIAAVHVYWAAYRYSRMPGGTKPGVVQIQHNVI